MAGEDKISCGGDPLPFSYLTASRRGFPVVVPWKDLTPIPAARTPRAAPYWE